MNTPSTQYNTIPGQEQVSPTRQCKAFLVAAMAPWTSVAGYSYAAAAPVSMEPWTAIKKALPQCNTSTCPGPYPMTACTEVHVGCKLGRERFTLLVYRYRCPWRHGQRSKRNFHSVALTETPVRVPTLRPVFFNVTSVIG